MNKLDETALWENIILDIILEWPGLRWITS